MAAAGADEGDSLDSDSDDLLIDGDNDDEVTHLFKAILIQALSVTVTPVRLTIGYGDTG